MIRLLAAATARLEFSLVIRGLLNLLTILSLLLCVTAVVFWVRGYVAGREFIKYQRIDPRLWTLYQLGSRTGGQIDVTFERHTFTRDGLVEEYRRLKPFGSEGFSYIRLKPKDDILGSGSMFNRMGFGVHSSAPSDAGGTYGSWSVWFPHWFVIVLSGILPMVWLLRSRRQRVRIAGNCCLTCGYDLRASPDRCPECGAVRGNPGQSQTAPAPGE
jgi:hypothetical protein